MFGWFRSVPAEARVTVVPATVAGLHGAVVPAGATRQVRVLQHDGRVDRLHGGRTSGAARPVADGRRDARAGRPGAPKGHVQRHAGPVAVPAGHVPAGRA